MAWLFFISFIPLKKLEVINAKSFFSAGEIKSSGFNFIVLTL